MTSEDDRRSWLDDAYRRHKDSIFRTCLRFGAGDRDFALDCTQEVFVIAHEKQRQLRAGDAAPWLRKIAVRTCLMRLRRRRVFDRIRSAFDWALTSAEPARPDDLLGVQDDLERLQVCLGALPPLERSVLVLVNLEERTQAEAAELLGISKGYLSKVHHKALTRLSKNWGRDE